MSAPSAADAGPGSAEASWVSRNRDLLLEPGLVVVLLVLLAVVVTTAPPDFVTDQALTWPAILSDLGRHLVITAVSTVVVVVIAVPLGVALSRRWARRLRAPVLALGSFAQALPPFGVLILLAFATGFSFAGVILGLVLAALLPVLTNTVVGLEQVDRSLVEAARGLGMSTAQTLLRVEAPLAVPVVVAGLRVALVLNVGTGALAALVNSGGLGDLVLQGNSLGRPVVLTTGAVLLACLALLVDWLAGLAERRISRRTAA